MDHTCQLVEENSPPLAAPGRCLVPVVLKHASSGDGGCDSRPLVSLSVCTLFGGAVFPEVIPPPVGPQDPQSEHGVEGVGAPACSRDFEPLLRDVAV